MPLSCWSCTHCRAIETEEGQRLWCALHADYAEQRCDEFEYEPGSDQGEE